MSYCTLEEAWGPIYKKKKGKKKQEQYQYQTLDSHTQQPTEDYQDSQNYKDISTNFDLLEGFSDHDDTYLPVKNLNKEYIETSNPEPQTLTKEPDLNYHLNSIEDLDINGEDDVDTDTDINNNEINNNDINNNDINNNDINNNDINETKLVSNNCITDAKIMELSEKINLIMDRLNINVTNIDLGSSDNIHNIILFIIFGIFVIFLLDTILKAGIRIGKV